MRPRPPTWPFGDVCWKCQWRIANQRHASTRLPPTKNANLQRLPPRRALHASSSRKQSLSATTVVPEVTNPAILNPKKPIRDRLQLWQEEHGAPDEETLKAFANHPLRSNIQNSIAKMNVGNKSDQAPTTNEVVDGADDELDEAITIGLFLKPGDVVELSRSGSEPVLAVYVQQLDRQSQFYSVNGRWSHALLSNVSFAIQRCIDPALVDRLVPYLPTAPSEASLKGEIHVPPEIGAPVQHILERMTRESENIYRENSTELDNAYATLADKTRMRMMTLQQIARDLLNPLDASWTPSSAALLAVRKALHHDEFRFPSDSRSHRLTNVFSIRAKDDVEIIETVHRWIRAFGEQQAKVANPFKDSSKTIEDATYVSSFISKARRLIKESRKYRDALPGFVGPVKSPSPPNRVHWGDEFNLQDRHIIDFLKAWVLTAQFERMPNLHSACCTLLVATGCYEADAYQIASARDDPRTMGRETGHLFLQEIGVTTPYENRFLYDEHLTLPTISLSRNLELLTTNAELTRRNPDFRDSMGDIRRDWGDMHVYCIDGLGAKEIDDGISIEKVEGNDSEAWIHVHVANPTAFFDKTHVLSGLAAHLTETVYTPERTFPMLPTWTSQNYFSIGQDRPVITFSTRLSMSDGAVLEKKVQPGIVRRVTSITPDEVAESLGETEERVTMKIVVGGQPPSSARERAPPTLSSGQLQELQDLYGAARLLWKTRAAAGGIRIKRTTTDCHVYNTDRDALAWAPPSMDRARYIRRDPIIEVNTRAVQSFSASEITAKDIVEEMMLLACQTAAAWCAERNIPVMYRGTIETPTSAVESPARFLEDVVQPYIQKHGQMSQALSIKYLQAVGRSISLSSPFPHRIIGAESYLRVTSPLRRFSDMMSHWQIEAALRYEAKTGNKFDLNQSTPSTSSVLPFSPQQMQESIISLTPRERLIRTAQRNSQQLWTVMAFMRAFHYNEAKLPETFRAQVERVPSSEGSRSIGSLSDFSVGVLFESVPGLELKADDEWEVSIREFELFSRYIHVTPIRLLHRGETAL